jgi:hypothetical protein
MGELSYKSALELSALIREREVKPSEAVAHALARVEALNGKLNAFCAMRAEQAMANKYGRGITAGLNCDGTGLSRDATRPRRGEVMRRRRIRCGRKEPAKSFRTTTASNLVLLESRRCARVPL